MSWRPRQLGRQTGRSFFVTGANSGIGLEAARELVGRGAHVVLAVCDTAKGEQAAARLAGSGSTSVVELDLSDLDQVAGCAETLARPPRRALCPDLQCRRHGRPLPVDRAGLRAADGYQPPGSRRAGNRAVAAAARERRARRPGVEHRGARRAAVAADDRGSSCSTRRRTTAGRSTGTPSRPTCCSRRSCTAAVPRPVRRSAPSPCTRAPARPTCSPASYVAEGTIPGAVAIPHHDVIARRDELDRERPTVWFCSGPAVHRHSSGNRGAALGRSSRRGVAVLPRRDSRLGHARPAAPEAVGASAGPAATRSSAATSSSQRTRPGAVPRSSPSRRIASVGIARTP